MQIGRNSSISPQAIIEQPENITVGDNVQIKAGVVLRPETGCIAIGNNVVINHYTVIHAKGGVEIGDWSVIAPTAAFLPRTTPSIPLICPSPNSLMSGGASPSWGQLAGRWRHHLGRRDPGQRHGGRRQGGGDQGLPHGQNNRRQSGQGY